jgi:hypothetical protein
MGGMLLIGLLIVLWHLVVSVWPLLLVAGVVYAGWRWLVLAAGDARAREVRDQLRHEQARREIDRIALEATRAMYDAALSHGEVIEGTAVEVERR